jgi:hypothetical protein
MVRASNGPRRGDASGADPISPINSQLGPRFGGRVTFL